MAVWHDQRSKPFGVALAFLTAIAGAAIMDLYHLSLSASRGTLLLAVIGGAASSVGSVWKYDKPRSSVVMIVAGCVMSPAAAPGLWVVLYALGTSRRYRLLADCVLASVPAIFVCAALYLWQNALRTTALETLVILALALACSTALAGAASGVARTRFEQELRESIRREGEAAFRATRDERALLSRELHDLVGHRLALLNIFSAGLAARTDEVSPELRQHLTVINDNVTEAGLELHQLLRVIDQRNVSDDSSPLVESIPVLESREALFARFSAAGMQLTVRGNADVKGATTAHERTLERFCREGLTNALKHAGPGPVVVEVETSEDDGIRARIRSPYAPATAVVAEIGTPHGGAGLVGLQERAALLGGSVWTTITEQHRTLHLSLPGRDTTETEPQP